MNTIGEIQKGNTAVFEEVYYQYHEQLYFTVLKKTASAEMAREVVQQAFIKLWEHREKLSPDFSVKTQLFRITRNLLIDLLRKKATAKKLLQQLEWQSEAWLQPEQCAEKELVHTITTVVNTLPPVCRKVFKMSREEGLSHKEIAQRLLISPKSVENHIAKALKQVKRALSYLRLLFLFY